MERALQLGGGGWAQTEEIRMAIFSAECGENKNFTAKNRTSFVNSPVKSLYFFSTAPHRSDFSTNWSSECAYFVHHLGPQFFAR